MVFYVKLYSLEASYQTLFCTDTILPSKINRTLSDQRTKINKEDLATNGLRLIKKSVPLKHSMYY